MNAHVLRFGSLAVTRVALSGRKAEGSCFDREGGCQVVSTHRPGNQHPPAKAAWPLDLASPNSRGPQGDPWPPARAARTPDARPTRPSFAAHRGPRRTWAARAPDSTSPRRHGSSPGPVPPPPSHGDLSPDFSLTAATASFGPALPAGWSAERRPAADWPPRLFGGRTFRLCALGHFLLARRSGTGSRFAKTLNSNCSSQPRPRTPFRRASPVLGWAAWLAAMRRIHGSPLQAARRRLSRQGALQD